MNQSNPLLKLLIFFHLLLAPSFCDAQFFSLETEDSLKRLVQNYMDSNQEEVTQVLSLVKHRQTNLLSSILAEFEFKNVITEFNKFDLLSENEKAVQKKIYFRVDTTTYFTPTHSVSSRWIKGIPYIEYYPKWVFGFTNYIYMDVVAQSREFNRTNFTKIFNLMLAINDSLDAVEEANLDSKSNSKVYSLVNVLGATMQSYCSYLFIYLHELAHLTYPNSTEIEADKFASEKVLKFINLTIPNNSASDDKKVEGVLKEKVPLNTSKYSLYWMATTHLDYLNTLFAFSVYDYDKTIADYFSRKKYLYTILSDQLKCSTKENSTTSICSGINNMVLEDEEIGKSIFQNRNLLSEWNKNLNKDANTFDSLVTTFPKREEAFFRLGIMLCKSQKYGEASILFKLIAEDSLANSDIKEQCFLLLSKIYQHRIHNKDNAIIFLKKALQFSSIMPRDFYENAILKLKGE